MIQVCYIFFFLQGNPCGKTDEWIFMKFSWKVGHETKNNLKHFCIVVINPLTSGSIFLLCESVIVSTIMEKWKNGFSWNFQEKLDMRQRTIWIIFLSWWLTPWIQDRFFLFCESVIVNTIMEKRKNGFSWFFQKILYMRQRTIWNIFRVLVINPLNSDWFSWNFHDILGTAQQIIK